MAYYHKGANEMFRLAVIGFLSLFLLNGCMSAEGNTAAEKRQSIQQMRSETLSKLYQIHPGARSQIENAVGYGVFSNVGINLFLLSTASGWGVVRDGGNDVYMKMYSAGVGPGLGVKDFRGVFVFTTSKALRSFVDKGWEANVQADAAAKSAEKGDAWSGAIDVAPGIKLYQITEHGLALQATIQGTKFWKDDELN